MLSYFFPVKVQSTSSPVNRQLEVTFENGKLVLNAAHANYSFGSLHKVFQHTFRHLRIHEREINNVLLLGLGAGSVPQILFDRYKMNCRITAVELDEKVIELANTYFSLSRHRNLEIVCADAFEYVKNCNRKFDLVVVDVFVDNTVPEQFLSQEFLLLLKSALCNKGMLLFNTIPHVESAQRNEKLITGFIKTFSNAASFKYHGNAVLIHYT